MPGVMDIIVRAQDEASAVLAGIGDAGENAGSLIEQHWLTATAALATAGAGIEGLARSQQDATIQAGQLARRLGESEDTVRSWATETSNAGFALDEVVDLMEIAARRGLEGKGALQDYANFWDTVADASGESAVALGQAGVGLQGIGIAAGQEGHAIDALGFVMDNTTAGVAEFLTFIERMGPDLREIGVDVNDTAAIMGVLENELGLSGRTARSEFRQAIAESDGTLGGMLDTLGVSEEQFARWREQVEGSGQAIEENAQIADEALTPFQQLQTSLGDLAYSFGPVINGAADLAPLLIAAGPAARGAQLAMTGIQRVAPLVGAAMHLMLGPIGLVTLAIGALAAAFAFDFLGIRTATEEAVDDMAMNFGTMGDAVHRLADETGVEFQEMKDRIKTEMEESGDSFEQVVRRIDAGGEALSEAQWDAVEESGNAWAAYQTTLSDAMYGSEEILTESTEAQAETIGSLPELGADALLANQQKLVDATTELVEFMDEALSPAQEKFRLRGFLSSDELAAGLADGNPLVRQKAEELRAAAQERLDALDGYSPGATFVTLFATAVEQNAWRAVNAVSMVAAQVRGIMPSSEPRDPSSPFRGITNAWGFMDVLAAGLESHADAPARAMARAMGLVSDEIDVPTISGARVLPDSLDGFSGAGSISVYQLIVQGEPIVLSRNPDDVLDRWEQMVGFGEPDR